MNDLSDEQVDRLLDELDRMARQYDRYEYGLPVHAADQAAVMRETVRDWLRDVSDERRA